MLRRAKTIVFRDEPEARESAQAVAEQLRAGRRELGSFRTEFRTTPRQTAPEPEAEPTDEASPVLAGARQRMEFLRDELDREPISKGAQESLAALRAEFRRKHIESPEDLSQPPSPATGNWGGIRPSRVLLVAVAVIAGGLAAFLALNRPAPEQPVSETAQPVEVAVPTVQVLVAKDAIGIGQRLTAAALEWQPWPEAAIRPEYITDTVSPEAMTDIDGSVARFEFFAGETIRQQKLTEAGAGFLSAILAGGMRGVSVEIEAASASGGFIVPNDRVDVVLTRSSELTQGTQTILHNVRVLAINSTLGDTVDSDETAPDVVFEKAIATLELDPAQAEVLINATTIGSLSLVLRPLLDFDEAGKADQRATNQAIRISSPFWAK